MAKTDWRKLGPNYFHTKAEYTVKLNAKGIKTNHGKSTVKGFVNFFILPIKGKFHAIRTATGAFEISTRIFNDMSDAQKYMSTYMEKHTH